MAKLKILRSAVYPTIPAFLNLPLKVLGEMVPALLQRFSCFRGFHSCPGFLLREGNMNPCTHLGNIPEL